VPPAAEIEQCLRPHLRHRCDTLQSLATEAGDGIKVLDEDQNEGDLDLTGRRPGRLHHPLREQCSPRPWTCGRPTSTSSPRNRLRVRYA